MKHVTESVTEKLKIKMKWSFTCVDIPDTNTSVNVTSGQDELFTEVETFPIVPLRLINQLILWGSATEGSWVNGWACIDAHHLTFDLVSIIVGVIFR